MSIRSLGNPIAKYKAVWERTGVGALPIPTAFSATGGTKTTSGSNVIHSFTSPGTFSVDNAPPTFIYPDTETLSTMPTEALTPVRF